MSIDNLRQRYPWPAEPPSVAIDRQGWFLPEHRPMLARRLDLSTKVVLELGSWLGQSTRMLLELAGAATLVCVDTWMGSSDMVGNPEAESRMLRAYDTFLINQWQWRDRVIPVREDVFVGMKAVAAEGIKPDLILFDDEHTTDHLLRELEMARVLFPDALLYGDDWGWESVRNAVTTFARKYGHPISAIGNAWALDDRGTT